MKKKNQCKQLGDTLNEKKNWPKQLGDTYNEKKISVNTSSQEIPTMKKNQNETK